MALCDSVRDAGDFFISGASLSVTRKRRTPGAYIVNRLKRLYLPYFVYIIAMIAIVIAVGYWSGRHWLQDHSVYVMVKVIVKQVFLVEQSVADIPYLWHLWFIVPYLVIALLFCFEQLVADRLNRWLMLALAVAVWALCLVFNRGIVNQITAYNIFFLAGYLLYRQCSLRTVLVIAAVSLAIVTGLSIGGVDFCPMQDHKISSTAPDLMFISFGSLALSLLSILLWRVRLPANRLIKRWNVNGYTIYLWQNLIFWMIVGMLPSLRLSAALHPVVNNVLIAGLVFVLATALSFLTVPLERWTTGMVSALFCRLAHLFRG